MDISNSIKKAIFEEIEPVTDLDIIWTIYSFVQSLLMLPIDDFAADPEPVPVPVPVKRV
jgi:hypothetical protein